MRAGRRWRGTGEVWRRRLQPSEEVFERDAQSLGQPHHLYRAYLMKEQLREVFTTKGAHGRQLLAGLISWAARSRIPEMLALSRTLRRYRDLIINAVDHGVSNALAEATNTHIQALIRRARGYHTPESLIAIINLTRGGFCPPLPGRTP